MNTVSFQNNSLIDPVSIKTFGVSVKDCENPIGFFGTGLKYAIAILLRNRCNIVIYRGHEEFRFSTVKKIIRDKEFDIVCMNDEEMGFTLELGKTWEMWQAFRELYCNTLDEGGEVFGNDIPVEEGHTTVTVTGESFYQEYVNKPRTILQGKATYTESTVEVHSRPSSTIFLGGIRVGQFDYPSIFTYNILKGVALTEDRTVKSMTDVHQAIRSVIVSGTNKKLIREFVLAPSSTYESEVDMSWYDVLSDTFLEVLSETPFRKIHNRSIIDLYNKHKEKNKLPEVLATDAVNEIERAQLKKAIDFAHCLDFPVDRYPIHITDDLRDEVLGTVLHDEIYIARRTFVQGTKMVAATLIEEFIHIDKGFKDRTYTMQNYLFEKLVSLGEQLVGEPL